jgi:peptidoglycan/xylan/chitin deacetylase (PgdA/CDA1 family)
VPSVPAELFRAQVEALATVCDLVSLEDVLVDDAGTKPRVALSFDDDLPSHVRETLPILSEAGLPAAFFLSGRALHGLGSYWFQRLEALVATHGEEETAARLGLRAASADELALACERDDGLRARIPELAEDVPEPDILDREGIAGLAAAGMTVGFHTVDHRIMPTLDDAQLAGAVTSGRDALASVVGHPLRYFAYPHGKADARTARAVRGAGFLAAWTGRPEPLRRGSDRYLLGRWEPGSLPVDDMLVKLVIRLHRATLVPQQVPS